jgi:hypothetical protein
MASKLLGINTNSLYDSPGEFVPQNFAATAPRVPGSDGSSSSSSGGNKAASGNVLDNLNDYVATEMSLPPFLPILWNASQRAWIEQSIYTFNLDDYKLIQAAAKSLYEASMYPEEKKSVFISRLDGCRQKYRGEWQWMALISQWMYHILNKFPVTSEPKIQRSYVRKAVIERFMRHADAGIVAVYSIICRIHETSAVYVLKWLHKIYNKNKDLAMVFREANFNAVSTISSTYRFVNSSNSLQNGVIVEPPFATACVRVHVNCVKHLLDKKKGYRIDITHINPTDFPETSCTTLMEVVEQFYDKWCYDPVGQIKPTLMKRLGICKNLLQEEETKIISSSNLMYSAPSGSSSSSSPASASASSSSSVGGGGVGSAGNSSGMLWGASSSGMNPLYMEHVVPEIIKMVRKEQDMYEREKSRGRSSVRSRSSSSSSKKKTSSSSSSGSSSSSASSKSKSRSRPPAKAAKEDDDDDDDISDIDEEDDEEESGDSSNSGSGGSGSDDDESEEGSGDEDDDDDDDDEEEDEEEEKPKKSSKKDKLKKKSSKSSSTSSMEYKKEKSKKKKSRKS